MKAARAGSTNRRSIPRSADDHYPTPLEAVYPLIASGILDSPPLMIWEPACGEGHISRVLTAAGHQVVSSNLIDRGYGAVGVDFLATTKTCAPCVVTNPPYALAQQFVEHAIALPGVNLALFLLRTKFVESRRRARLFLEHPPARIWQFIDRPVFYSGDVDKAEQPGWNTEAFAWFEWRPSEPQQHAQMRWIWKDDGRQLGLEI